MLAINYHYPPWQMVGEDNPGLGETWTDTFYLNGTVCSGKETWKPEGWGRIGDIWQDRIWKKAKLIQKDQENHYGSCES